MRLTAEELATVLAALRYWQNDMDDPSIGGDLYDVATNGGEFEHLSADEVDALCERLNAGDDQVRVLVAAEGGVVTAVLADRPGVMVQVVDYDTDDADEAMLFSIPQDDGTHAQAHSYLQEADVLPEFIAAAALAVGGAA